MIVPDDLDGSLNCVIVAFRQRHQQLVDTWLPLLGELADANPGFCYYELPAIGRRWSIARSFIDGGMAKAITDRATRERTITAYTNTSPIIDGLGLEGDDTIAVVLVLPSGEIVWQGAGALTPESSLELTAAVEASL